MKKRVNDQQPEYEHAIEISTSIQPGEIIIGTVTGFDDQLQPLVSFADSPNGKAQAAVSTLSIHKKHIGRQAALLFANGDPTRPVIMGLIHNPLHEMLETFEVETTASPAEHELPIPATSVDDLSIDGKRIVLEGKEEIVLKCGDASITLTKAGKILIRGKYLMNRSSGMNRIMGGSVQIN